MKLIRILTIVASIITVLFVFCFTACGSQAEEPASSGGLDIEITQSGGGPSGGDEPADSGVTQGGGNQDNDFIGLWHESPVVGSGFSARLLLDSDNTFIWTASQMDGLERVRACSGNWGLVGDKLELETMEEIRWTGGQLVPAYASWGTEEVIDGAEAVLVKHEEPVLTIYELGTITIDTGAFDKRTITVGGIQYWELSGQLERDELISEYEDMKAESTPTSPVFSQDLPEAPGLWAVEYVNSGAEPLFRVHVAIPVSSHDIVGAYHGSGTAVLGIQYDEGNGRWRSFYDFDLWEWDGPIVMSAIFMELPTWGIDPYPSFRARMTHSYYDSDGNLRLSDSDWSEVVIAGDEEEYP